MLVLDILSAVTGVAGAGKALLGVSRAAILPRVAKAAEGVKAGRVVLTTGKGIPVTVTDLLTAASSPNRNLLTDAGRALQKHSSRGNSAFKTTATMTSALNQEAQAIVAEILGNPRTKIIQNIATKNKQPIKFIDVIAPDGRTLRFSEDGRRLVGFREP